MRLLRHNVTETRDATKDATVVHLQDSLCPHTHTLHSSHHCCMPRNTIKMWNAKGATAMHHGKARATTKQKAQVTQLLASSCHTRLSQRCLIVFHLLGSARTSQSWRRSHSGAGSLRGSREGVHRTGESPGGAGGRDSRRCQSARLFLPRVSTFCLDCVFFLSLCCEFPFGGEDRAIPNEQL